MLLLIKSFFFMSIFDPNNLYKRDYYDTRKGQVLQQKLYSVPGSDPPEMVKAAENWAKENGMFIPPGPWINADQIHYLPFTINLETNSPFQILNASEYIARSGITPHDIASILHNNLMSYYWDHYEPGSYIQLSFEVVSQTFRRRCDNLQVTFQIPESIFNYQNFIEGLDTLATPQHTDHYSLLLDQYMAIYPANHPGSYPDSYQERSTWNGTSNFVIDKQYLLSVVAKQNDAIRWIMNEFHIDDDPIIYSTNVVGMIPKQGTEFWGLSSNVQIQGRLLIVNAPLI